MRRPFASVLALAAAAAVIPLASPAPAATDSVVIGGYPVDISESPWTVALSSRDRFGGTRAGQFCGGVVIGPSTVLTAAHCLGADVLGAPPSQVRDLKVIAGRGDLLSNDGKEIPVRDIWVNPDYDGYTNAGDFGVLTLTAPLPESSVIRMAPAGDPAYEPDTAAVVYGWGDTTGGGDYARGLRATRVNVLPDAACERAYPGSADGAYEAASMLCAGEVAGGRDACQGTAAGRWSPRGGSSAWCPGGEAVGAPGAQGSTRGSRTWSRGSVGAAEGDGRGTSAGVSLSATGDAVRVRGDR